jgi:hypothetical protein
MTEMETRICNKCFVEKPLTEFAKHKSSLGGRIRKCKSCHSAYAAKYRRQNREKVYQQKLAWKRTPAGRRLISENGTKSCKINRKKWNARQQARRAAAKGKIAKTPCVFCGSQRVQAHHEDYDKPLEVVWVCYTCHAEKIHGCVVTHGF